MKIEDIIDSPFTFTRRKNHLACDIRPLWKICLVVLILGITGRDMSASIKKIHVASWAVKRETHLDALIIWAGKDSNKRPDVRLDPYLDEVVDLMFSSGFLGKNGDKLFLTDSGVSLFELLKNNEVFIKEITSIDRARKTISEAAVKRIFEGF
jgi:hypothetical protein